MHVRVEPLPAWLDLERFLGPHDWQVAGAGAAQRTAEARVPVDEAAQIAARLRGLGLAGQPLQVTTTPRLSREEVRAGRLHDARARRATSVGFTRAAARATGEGRFSLTPEPLALALGQTAAGRSVVDACCGSGGSSIGFARAGCPVIAIEHDAERLAEARHNAQVYDVAGRLRFLAGDASALLPTLRADILFIDPPWGGEAYDRLRTDLQSMPLLARLLALDLSQFGELWLKLPGSFDTRLLPDARVQPWFGAGEGDRRRIKFLLLTLAGARP